MTENFSTRISAFLATSMACALALVHMAGCQTDVEKPAPENAKEPVAVVSDIPLRVWIVAPLKEPDLLKRQWLANSEQPLELRSMTVQELIEQPRCQCDVLVYPAGLMGDLVQRGWIVKLPPSVAREKTGEEEEGETPSHSATGRAQAAYGGELLGISLGCAVTTFVGSASLDNGDGAMSWEKLLGQLQVKSDETPQFVFSADQVDAEALVDRFLAIVATLSQRDPNYGLLFELQTMRSRLTASEYQQAAGILAALAGQPDGLLSVVGSHSTAWTWATSRDVPAIGIAAPSLLDSQAAAIATGSLVRIEKIAAISGQDVEDDATNGLQSERPRVQWWSSGAGLVASLSSNCRQTNQANLFLGWLHAPTTRGVLTTLLPGVEAAGATAASNALSAKAIQALAQEVAVTGLSLEPRLPSALIYRQALASELQLFLSGEKSSQQALQDAARSWDAITQQVGSSQRRNYEQSLNL